MSEPSAAFKDFRAQILYLARGYECWPPTEAMLAPFRDQPVAAGEDDDLERAIADLWEQARTAELFAPIEAQEKSPEPETSAASDYTNRITTDGNPIPEITTTR